MVSQLLSPLTSCSPRPGDLFLCAVSHLEHFLHLALARCRCSHPHPSLSVCHCSVSNGSAPSQQFHRVDAGQASALTNATPPPAPTPDLIKIDSLPELSPSHVHSDVHCTDALLTLGGRELMCSDANIWLQNKCKDALWFWI